ncbi:putative pumilio-like protein 23-like [Sesbania bispinosa]|nr:putative pumilio-like protein 23-like [Sesbania bispinosa]
MLRLVEMMITLAGKRKGLRRKSLKSGYDIVANTAARETVKKRQRGGEVSEAPLKKLKALAE